MKGDNGDDDEQQDKDKVSGGVDLSLNSLDLILFNYVNYKTEVGFDKRVSNAHRKRQETPLFPTP